MNVSSLHLSGPTPKLAPSLAFLVFVKGVNIHSHLSLKSQCCSVTNMGWLLSQYPFLSSPHCSQHQDFLWGAMPPNLFLLCGLGRIYPGHHPSGGPWLVRASEHVGLSLKIGSEIQAIRCMALHPTPLGQTLVQFGPNRVNAWLSYNGWRKKPLFCFEWGGM